MKILRPLIAATLLIASFLAAQDARSGCTITMQNRHISIENSKRIVTSLLYCQYSKGGRITVTKKPQIVSGIVPLEEYRLFYGFLSSARSH